VLGFVASRFLKASSRKRYEQSLAERRTQPGSRYGTEPEPGYGSSARGGISPAVPAGPRADV
jgi:hypothetical protein